MAIAAKGLDHPGVLTPLEQAHQPVAAAVEPAADSMPCAAAIAAGWRGGEAQKGEIPGGARPASELSSEVKSPGRGTNGSPWAAATAWKLTLPIRLT